MVPRRPQIFGKPTLLSRIERIMRIEFERGGTTHRGKVVATIVEEKDVNIRTTVQVIRFVVMLKDGTFTSVPMNECRKVRSWWKRITLKMCNNLGKTGLKV
jgi:hypothetical protein